MDVAKTAAQLLSAYQELGEEAFTQVILNSRLTDAEIDRITQQIYNLPVIKIEDVLRIRSLVAEKGRQEVKNDLLNSGQSEEAIEFTFSQAGV